MTKKSKNLKIMLSTMIIMIFLFIPLCLNGQTGKTNFSGTWTLNADKSTFGMGPGGQAQQGRGPGGGFGSGNLVVKQESNNLVVERTRGEQTVTFKYTLDGKESINSTGRGESKSTAGWSADGKTLKIVTIRSFSRDGQTTEMKTAEEWTLTSPAVLTITSAFSTPNGERKSTMIYDRK